MRIERNINAAADKARKVRLANRKKRKAALQTAKTPEIIVVRDQRILHREISKWTCSKMIAVQQISHLQEVLKKVQKAATYLMSAPPEIMAGLVDGKNWSLYPELAYIYDMRELF